MPYPESKYLLNDGKIYTAKEISKEINLGVDAVKVRLNKTRDVDQIFAKKGQFSVKTKKVFDTSQDFVHSREDSTPKERYIKRYIIGGDLRQVNDPLFILAMKAL